MAVVTEQRNRPDRVAKDPFLSARSREDHILRKNMSYPMPSQPPGANDQITIASNDEDRFVVPHGAIDRDGLKKRKASKSRPNDLRRSASTPHLGKTSQSDAGVMSPTNEKKRNKLGYHRSSIACSHCRRRKIRCQLPIPEDAQGRCTNCIRLKKECNFYPVDQAPSADSRAAHPVRKDTALSGAPSASSQSSPHLSGVSLPGSVADEAAHVQLHSPKADAESQSHQESAGYGIPVGTEASAQNVPFQFAKFGGGAWNDPQQGLTQYPQQHRASIADPQYWSVNSTPTTSHYSHDSAMSFNPTTPTAFATPNFAYTNAGNVPFVPARSLSFGQIEGMPQAFGYQSVQYGHQETHPGYAIASQQHFAQPGAPQQAQGNIPQANGPSEATPRGWTTAPSVQAPLPSNAPYQPSNMTTYYPSQQAMDVYNGRTNPTYHSTQFYPVATNPG
ncbi:uncharacterized protein PV09_00471 [Verruconis gallopava]|uniref:Zn(2)-C6 fungal-type domain-containing protein n=1 Tax=Verruconis gallopava TaxID=253628 RepID=A0A0D1Z9G1_9PEZI|nr:uncharacterized protein PV09_00471 [Verruconis gallopava]KIW09602.1 hypothetical protein PV09_00471 [Verruconis gallopava]